ncbi:hypothetical protein B7463_g8190, partial [Scytalidium lignicola]
MGNSGKHSYSSAAERKAKKRKLEDAIPDIPGNDDEELEEPTAPLTKKNKRRIDTNKTVISTNEASTIDSGLSSLKNGGESKKQLLSREEIRNDGLVGTTRETQIEEQAAVKKSKKERKAERKAREAADGVKQSSGEASVSFQADVSPGDTMDMDTKSQKKNEIRRENKKPTSGGRADRSTYEKDKNKAPRFIVFIGNLPFSATQDSIKDHFKAVKPTEVRHLTQKDDPTKSKGCAFVEFEGYDHMKTCLKLYHHSMFDDGISPPRKINVELTAGGGGNAKDRRAKIQEKNQKLNEQRIRRIQEEEKAKWAKNETSDHGSGIHPSRRGMVPLA